MQPGIRFVTLLGLIFALSSPAATRAEDTPSKPLILVHVMPWFETKDVSGTWGWHWTMGHFNPDRMDSKGQRQIASHDYPLIGPYDSADPDVLEYHTLLMKLAGIDGVIADWYGSEDVNDYAMIHRRTSLLFETLQRRGLKFAVCYEDRALKAMADKRNLTPAQAVEHGKTHLRFCEQNWFGKPTYATWEGKPLLLVFGPDYLSPEQWEAVFSGLRRPPAFFTLHERRPPAIGSFAWPPMWASKDGVLDARDLDAYLDRFSRQPGAKIACAFPGFHDIYHEAEVRPSYGYLDARNGETFRHTLDRALALESPVLQIATWNDFGEGTCIEPTHEYGYRYLEAIQEVRRRIFQGRFPYQSADLRLALRIYHLRKRFASSSPEWKALDQVVDLVFSGEVGRASRRLDDLEKELAEGSPPER